MRALFAFAALLLTAAPAAAQHSFSAPGSSYDPKVPTPRAVLGYEIGERFTPHHMIVRYIERMAAASPRVRVDTVARTAEGREMLVVTVASERNIARLGEIKRDAKRIADPRGATAGELASARGRLPVIVWLAHSVHGGEASGVEAGLALLYQLAAGTDADTRLALDSAVVLIDPNENPDGRERHVHDVQRMSSRQGVSLDPAAMSNGGSWPGPRTSHYYFDLNRDWFIQSHPETRGRVASFLSWWPHVAIDLHEMGTNSSFYFAPPMEPNNKNNPKHLDKWFELFGRAHARAFDEFGWSFFRREGYDSFYPGYGESWPMLTGAIGMLFESASSSGGAVRRVDGTVRTLHDAAWQHYTAEWTTVRTSARHASAIVSDYAASRQETIAIGTRGPMRAIVLEHDAQGRADSLAARLRDNGIDVRRLSSAADIAASMPFGESTARQARVGAGSYVIDLAQPQGQLARAILEPDAELDSAFITRELESRRTAQPDRFYDLTAWSMPYAYRVRAWWTRTLPAGLEAVSTAPAAVPAIAEGRYGYAFEAGSEASIRLLAALLSDSVRIWYAQRAFSSGGVRFPRGALVVRTASNAATTHETVRRHATAAGARVYPLASAAADDGADLGSNSVFPVRRPKVALLGGAPVNGNSFGFAWYAFDNRIGYPTTVLDANAVAGGALEDYNVLVVPSAPVAGLERALGDGGRTRLTDWVRNGGVLVTIDAATGWLATERLGLSRLRLRQDSTRADSTGGAPLPADVPGAIARAHGDTLSPLMAGIMQADFPVLVNSDRVLSVPKDLAAGQAVVRFAPETRVKLSGFFWPENAARLALSPYLWTERVGRGRVIGFAHDPNYRDLWRGLLPLFANAVLLGGSY